MTAGTTEEFQRVAWTQDLLGVFERMRERPRVKDGDRVRPALVLLGPDAATREVISEFARRCRDGGRDPYARITAATPRADDVAGLLRQASREISKNHPAREPAIRFPLLSMALWLLETRRRLQRLPADDGHPLSELSEHTEANRRQRALRKVIRQRGRVVLPADRAGERGKVATFFTYLEQVAPLGVAGVALLSVTAAGTLDLAAATFAAGLGMSVIVGNILARTRDWAGRRRYQWFCRQRYVDGHACTGFLDFALDVFDYDGPDEELDMLLVAAFREDLRQAYQRDVRRAQWARVRYPVLLFDRLRPGHEHVRFVGLLERVRRETATFDPLVVVAAVDPDDDPGLPAELAALAGPPPASEQSGTDQVAQVWADAGAAHERARALGVRRQIQVRVGADDAMAMTRATRVHRPRRRPLAASPVLAWTLMAVVLAGSLTAIGAITSRYCDPYQVWRTPDGECVGISDGSYVFSDRLAAVENRIHDLNEQVLDSGKPYVTMVYVGPMSQRPGDAGPQGDSLAGIHGELVGLTIAIEEYNSTGQPKMRLLLANTGARFAHAAAVAERVRRRAAEDPGLVAAVGFGMSKQQTQDAITVLSKAALPMIGTTNTFDGTARQGDKYSPYYFRLAPPNRRLAEHAAHWAADGRLGVRAERAAVIYDDRPDELYSPNLADDFAAAFGRAKVTMLPYTDASQIPAKVEQACAGPAEVFYYTGRSDDFQHFMNRLSRCSGRRTVIGGDEVTYYVSDHGAEIGGRDGLRLFFTPLAARESWVPNWVGDEPPPPFFHRFDALTAELEKAAGDDAPRPSPTHAAVAYDAALIVTSTVERIYGEQQMTLPTSGAVLASLTEVDDSPDKGATGRLRFSGRFTGHEIVDKPVLLLTVRPDGRQEVLAVCGALATDEPERAGCPPND